ncbi:MAG TPA: gliding motility lipoprotein GldD [Bacteroidia bacterium]|nr:gliding motility lipoprotein GldD [Bacteroidia bacterium]HNT79374.1 gliding motility lipoprotein GldD [Bacteroidia bacterium]
MNQKLSVLIILFFVLIIAACSSCNQEYVPKPKGFFRISFPEKKYIASNSQCAFDFQIPDYSVLLADTGMGKEPCWFNWNFPLYNAQIHLSYKPVHKNLQTYVEDSRTLVYKHAIKASSINEDRIYGASNVSGIMYSLGGQSASTVQFFLTDSTHHFIRGALYFNVETQPDSLAPVIDFIKKDIEHMIATLHWK